ncbi:hypothetical protein EV360DRAFT_56306 [Lentinula raphanica]|nr:hypothetical protein EV360DRAFT_56306 [Lentinula raphanica]
MDPCREPVVLLDAQDRAFTVLGGEPGSSKTDAWQAVAEDASQALEQCAAASSFTQAQLHGRRGNFASRTVGFGYGNGRVKPQNFRVSGKKNQAVTQALLHCRSIRRICGFQSNLYNSFNHKNCSENRQMIREVCNRQPELRVNFTNSPFAALTFNLGPQSWSPPHMDAENSASGWCADTALGHFNPDTGGQLVLWDLGLVIRFPPGSTILFPSALITHSTLPIQAHETRYAILQFTAGALFRWRDNGFQSDKAFLADASPEQLAERASRRVRRGKLALQKFSRWTDVCRGDWKGQARSDAGLDELSDLTDLDVSENDVTGLAKPMCKKRSRRT